MHVERFHLCLWFHTLDFCTVVHQQCQYVLSKILWVCFTEIPTCTFILACMFILLEKNSHLYVYSNLYYYSALKSSSFHIAHGNISHGWSLRLPHSQRRKMGDLQRFKSGTFTKSAKGTWLSLFVSKNFFVTCFFSNKLLTPLFLRKKIQKNCIFSFVLTFST